MIFGGSLRILATVTALLVTACRSRDTTAAPLIASRCLGISIPSSTELTLIGLYGGERADEDKGRPANEEKPQRVTLSSGWGAQPQIVVLSASDPVVWDFADVAADKIVGVIVYGYSRQAIANLPASIPVKQVSYTGGKFKSPDCGGYFAVHKGGPELDSAVAQVEQVTGLTVSRFHGANRAAQMSLAGDGQWPAPAPETYLMAESGPYVGIDPRERPDRGPGGDVVAALVADGILRPATQDDIDAWNARATQALQSGKLAAYASEYLQRPAAYVVLKPLPPHPSIHFRSFIYPADMPLPASPDTANNHYFMKTGTCHRASADCPGLVASKTSASSPWSN